MVEILDIAGHLTLQQMLERDLYQERLRSGSDVSFREFLYPLLQGYDSVAMSVDLELGGTDQTFNMLIGRKLVRAYLHKEKFVMTVPLLTDAKGVKIGKTEGNVIGLTDPPNEFFAKIMSLGDDAIIPCFTLLTDEPMNIIEGMQKKMKAGENPMVFKKQLAFLLTKQFNSEEKARAAQKEFETRVQKKDFQKASLPTFPVSALTSTASVASMLVDTGIASSRSDAKRLVHQGSVSIENMLATSDTPPVPIQSGTIIDVGKKQVKLI